MNGKGSKRRPGNAEAYGENYDAIFGKRPVWAAAKPGPKVHVKAIIACRVPACVKDRTVIVAIDDTTQPPVPRPPRVRYDNLDLSS